MIVHDLKHMNRYRHDQWKIFLNVLESIIRSDTEGYFKIGEDGEVFKISIEKVDE